MRNLDEIKRHRAQRNAYLAGDKIPGIKFRHNSHVEFEDPESDERWEGAIVGVDPRVEPEPIYTVERYDGGGDEEVLESKIRHILDPHEPILVPVAKGDKPIKPRAE